MLCNTAVPHLRIFAARCTLIYFNPSHRPQYTGYPPKLTTRTLSRGCTYNLPLYIKLIFFSVLALLRWGAPAPTAPPGYAYVSENL